MSQFQNIGDEVENEKEAKEEEEKEKEKLGTLHFSLGKYQTFLLSLLCYFRLRFWGKQSQGACYGGKWLTTDGLERDVRPLRQGLSDARYGPITLVDLCYK